MTEDTGHSPAAEAAADAVEAQQHEEALETAVVTSNVMAAEAGMEASEAHGEAAEAITAAGTATEMAVESASVAETAGELAQAAGEEAVSARKDVASLNQRMEDGFRSLHEKLDHHFSPPKPETAEVTEVHVGNAKSATGNNPEAQSPESGADGDREERKRRHRFGSRR